MSHSSLMATRRKPNNPVKTEDCSICYHPMVPLMTSYSCGHRFHSRCIKRWIEYGGTTCPLCRFRIEDDDS